MGTIARDKGQVGEAIRLLELGAELAGEVGFTWWQAGTLLELGELAVESGRIEEGKHWLLDGLKLMTSSGERQHRVYALALLARVDAEQGRHDRAGLLWGAVEAEEQRGRIGQWEDERDTYETHILVHAGPDFARGREEGRRLSLDEAVERTLAIS